MEPQSIIPSTLYKPPGSLAVEILGCITAAAILVSAVYPIAKLIAGWLGP